MLRPFALLLAAFYLGLLHVLAHIFLAGTLPAQASGSVIIGSALLIPGTSTMLTGNVWVLLPRFTVTSFGR